MKIGLLLPQGYFSEFEGWQPVENWPPAEAAAEPQPKPSPSRGRWVRMKY